MREDLTYIAIILDRSGSMGTCKQATIDGFNEFLNKQQQEPGEAKLYFAQFDDKYELVYDRPVKEADKLNDHTYVPRGLTALYDAIGKTVDDLGSKLRKIPEKERPAKVMVAVITDGYENHSHDYDSQRVGLMIREQKEKYNWDFIFIGANQDAILSAARIGIEQHKALTYTANNVRGVMGQSMSGYASLLRSSPSGSIADPLAHTFTDEERAQAIAP